MVVSSMVDSVPEPAVEKDFNKNILINKYIARDTATSLVRRGGCKGTYLGGQSSKFLTGGVYVQQCLKIKTLKRTLR